MNRAVPVAAPIRAAEFESDAIVENGDMATMRAQPLMMRECLDRYVQAMIAGGQSAHSIRALQQDYAAILGRVAACASVPTAVERIRLCDVTLDELEEAFADFAIDHAPSTVHRTWASWSGFYRWATINRWTIGSPMVAVDKPKQAPMPTPNRAKHRLSIAEYNGTVADLKK